MKAVWLVSVRWICEASDCNMCTPLRVYENEADAIADCEFKNSHLSEEDKADSSEYEVSRIYLYDSVVFGG